jgi:hypothetical protein
MALTRARPLQDIRIQNSVYDPNFLRHQARWIRDDLDLQIARDGPDALHSDDILNLDEFLRRLLNANISHEDIRLSRLHLALSGISGKATRWPTRLIERADAVVAVWEANHGPMKSLIPLLYEPGGRLHGVCKPEDINKEKLIIKWLKAPGVKLSPMLARRVGDLGFKPGECVPDRIFPVTKETTNTLAAGGSAHYSHFATASLTRRNQLTGSWLTGMERML